ncbi:transglutaminase family protein [Jiangella alba]|uniref:Transglutaminase-like enzyme, putative cysteine protease n=1 Tax=Jiangella alba TaxID=561176 RepID=A0A1H5HSW1_9ACTN|nr:transglutaminase family protein [Jiangella alba]SEE30890.1 Transglutaminase-like enzyme, putative cysteine protease [Jiangella alba]
MTAGGGAAGGWLLSVRHHTGYRYAAPVSLSYNEARVTPRSDPRQRVLDATVEVSPAASLYRYVDYFGSVVTAFDVHAAHSELTVTASCVVETAPAGEAAEPEPWSVLADDDTVDELGEYLTQTRRTTPDDELLGVAGQVRAAATPDDGARLAAGWTHGRLAYVTGSTSVHTNAVEALAEGRGVCQDFAHVTIALLRSAGVPARYVSGYLHPRSGAAVGETVTGESHAWVEWWAGGWRSYDPTNDAVPGPGHVVVARGRDYDDVTPLRGIYHGGDSQSLGVTVEVTRLR